MVDVSSFATNVLRLVMDNVRFYGSSGTNILDVVSNASASFVFLPLLFNSNA